MSDLELLAQYTTQRDGEAMAEIVRRYRGLVVAVARRVTGNPHDAEDVAQVCFAELAKNADQVRVNLAGYLHRTATRRAIDLVRRRDTRRLHEAAAWRGDDRAVDTLWFQIKSDLDVALADLDDGDRIPIVHHYLLGQSQRQVADELKVDQSTVARRITKGLDQLRRRLVSTPAVVPDAAILAAALEQYGSVRDAPEVHSTVAAVGGAQGIGSKVTAGLLKVLIMKKTTGIAVAVLLLTGLAGSVVVIRSAAQYSSSAPASPTTKPSSKARVGDAQSFFAAVDYDELEDVRSQLDADPTLASAKGSERGETALHRARSLAVAKLLLDAGADPNARDREFGARPIRWQASQSRHDIVGLLEGAAGGDDDICYYVATGKASKVRDLLDADPSLVKMRTTKEVLGGGQSLLHLAAAYGNAEICGLLIDRGANVASEEGGFFNAQPLEVAAWVGAPEVVKALLARGADVNAVVKSDQGDHTAIWWAALTGRKEVVAILLEAGATVEPGLIDAVRRTEREPYPGRNLPPRQHYDEVIDMLTEHVEFQ